MNYYEIATLFLETFPDETIQRDRRLRKNEVEMLNMLVSEIKKLRTPKTGEAA
jgi:hypothetical protein